MYIILLNGEIMKKTNSKTAAFIMPVYIDNMNEFRPILEKSIQSVLNQSDKNLILIIIDDCSKDISIKHYLNNITLKDSRVIALSNKKNKGPGFSRNVGIDMAYKLGCPFILYNDSDDISNVNRLRETRKIFDNPKVNVVYSSFKVIDEFDNIVPEENLCDSIKEILDGHKSNIVEGENSWLKIALEKNYTNLTSATSVKTSLAHLEKFPNKRVSEDAHTWLRYGAHSGQFVFLKGCETLYRIKSNTESSTRSKIKNFYKLKASTDVNGFIKAEKIYVQRFSNIDKTIIKNNRAKFFLKEAISIALGKDYITATKLLNKAIKTNNKIVFEEIIKTR